MKNISFFIYATLFGAFASFAQTFPPVYELANQCVNIQYFDGQVQKPFMPNGQSSNYYLKPSGLGEFIIFNNNSEMLTADIFTSIKFTKDNRTDNAIWKLVPTANTTTQYSLQSKATGSFLTIDYSLFNFSWLTGNVQFNLTNQASKYLQLAIISTPNCTKYPEAEINAIGENHTGVNPDGTVWGIADVHNHPLSTGLGDGYMNAGNVFSPFGIQDAMGTCQSQHGKFGSWDALRQVLNGDLFSGVLSLSSLKQTVYNHNSTGYPNFESYPTFDDPSHQKSYYKWLERAKLGGLRLMTILTESNTAIANVLRTLHGSGTRILSPELKNPSATSLSGSEEFEKDMLFLTKLVQYVDAQEGGPGKGWLKIVRSPKEARTEINKGNLAIVIGMEIPDLLDCIEGTNVNCTAEYIKNRIAYYKSRGVSVIFPIHHWDNDFGGANIFTPFNELGNILYNKHTFTYEVASPNRGYSPIIYEGMISGVVSAPVSYILSNLFGIKLPKLENYSEGKKYSNALGLTSKGEILIKELMKNGIIIDLSHCSDKFQKNAEPILDAYTYPYIMSHDDEYQYSGNRVYSRKGLMSPRVNDSHDINRPECNCKFFTSKDVLKSALENGTYAQRYLGVKGSTLSSDFFGTLYGVAPRFNSTSNPCKNVESSRINYPFKSFDGKITFDKQKTGNRTFDYNTDGMAHYGLLPDMIEDLKVQGYSKEDIDVFFKGAEAYIRVWEATMEGSKKINTTAIAARVGAEAENQALVATNIHTQEINEVLRKMMTLQETLVKGVETSELVGEKRENLSPKVYPTLVEDDFTIEDKEKARTLEVHIHNTLGTELFNQMFKSIENQKIDVLDNAPEGIYIISILDKTNNLKYVFKLIKK